MNPILLLAAVLAIGVSDHSGEPILELMTIGTLIIVAVDFYLWSKT